MSQRAKESQMGAGMDLRWTRESTESIPSPPPRMWPGPPPGICPVVQMASPSLCSCLFDNIIENCLL